MTLTRSLKYISLHTYLLVADWNTRHSGRPQGPVHRNARRQRLQPGLERIETVQSHVSRAGAGALPCGGQRLVGAGRHCRRVLSSAQLHADRIQNGSAAGRRRKPHRTDWSTDSHFHRQRQRLMSARTWRWRAWRLFMMMMIIIIIITLFCYNSSIATLSAITGIRFSFSTSIWITIHNDWQPFWYPNNKVYK